MCKKDANKYAYLDQLSTRELREILRADIDSPESGDDEAIFYILEVMERREREHPSDTSSDLDRCWNDFQTLYHTPEGAGSSLYPTEDPEVPKETPQVSSHGRRHVRWLVLAAVVALLVVSLTVPVAGFANLFEMIGTWTAQQFAVTTDEDNSGGPTDNFEGAQVFEETPGDELRQVLKEYGITEDVVPTWMPEGFKIQGEVFVQEFSNPRNIQFFTLYSDGEDTIVMNFIKYASGNSVEKIYEKTAEAPFVYETDSVAYYLFESSDNDSAWSAVWYNDDLECSINTTLTKSDLEKILDSIYEE